MKQIFFSRSTLAILLAVAMVIGVISFADNQEFTSVEAATGTPSLLSQNWSNSELITVNDDWSGVTGIVGYRGDDLTAATGTDPRDIVSDGSAVVDVIANQDNPATLSSGGVAEFDGIANPTVAIQGSGTADAPHIVLTLNTTGLSNIRVQYNAIDIDDQTNNDATQQVNTQFRVGGMGDYTNVAGGYIADATTDGTNDVTAVDVTLPAVADNQALVEVRIMTTNAAGSDEWIGIDDITVTTGGTPMPTGDVDSDFDGDGKTDYGVVRDTTPGLQGGQTLGRSLNQRAIPTNENRNVKKVSSTTKNFGTTPTQGDTLTWFVNNSSDGSALIASFGNAPTDFWTPSDFDGDGKDDIAVWRGISDDQPSGNAFFFVLNSSDNTVDTVDFGVDGDNPTIVGDYDGDGKADPAVFRQPASAPFGPTTFFYKGSAGGGEITYVQWGDNTNEDLKAYPGDFDGDGKFDFCVFRRDPVNSQGQFALLRSTDSGAEFINWGIKTVTAGDILAPGDYDGDGKTDFMNIRVESGAVNWYLLERDGGGTGASPITWGTITIAGTSEFLAQGDYDGDGSTDIAIWRRNNTDPDNCVFYVLRSTDGALQTYEWGSTSDVPVNGWNAQ